MLEANALRLHPEASGAVLLDLTDKGDQAYVIVWRGLDTIAIYTDRMTPVPIESRADLVDVGRQMALDEANFALFQQSHPNVSAEEWSQLVDAELAEVLKRPL